MRIYLDTSVVGGTCDEEYAKDSLALISAVETGTVSVIISDILIGEIALAPDEVQDQFARLLRCPCERVSEVVEALSLRDAYMRSGILPPASSDDALHVAHATIARADVVATWNMRHLVNPTRVRAFNGVNISQGYGLVVITTPREILAMLEAGNGSS
jgi:hypothetical protein